MREIQTPPCHRQGPDLPGVTKWLGGCAANYNNLMKERKSGSVKNRLSCDFLRPEQPKFANAAIHAGSIAPRQAGAACRDRKSNGDAGQICNF